MTRFPDQGPPPPEEHHDHLLPPAGDDRGPPVLPGGPGPLSDLDHHPHGDHDHWPHDDGLSDRGASEVIRGTVTDEGGDCTAIRADDGLLYSVPARLTAVGFGDRIVLKGHRTREQECSRGITFEVEDAHRL